MSRANWKRSAVLPCCPSSSMARMSGCESAATAGAERADNLIRTEPRVGMNEGHEGVCVSSSRLFRGFAHDVHSLTGPYFGILTCSSVVTWNRRNFE
jgi:hypothetical protein